ncbi:MAG: DUF4114 domain-containing protein [Bacteroidia bacterium]|nr:DUF4114 domain-containing protein [Bacteroidia bacterium]
MKSFFSKIIFLLVVIVAGNTSLFAQYNFLSPYNAQGVPLNILTDSVDAQLLANIQASLPENYPVPTYHPEYLASGIDTDLLLTDSASVWVTFVEEGAGYRNVLGFYTYTGTPSPTPPSQQDITIIFPNVSKVNSGGGLTTGNQMFLGTFPAGTKIGWVLIANGFNINTGNVTNGNWILYSNPDYNPESDSLLRIHNVLLYDSLTQKLVLGFEDIRRDYGNCDQDFNDALFYVTTNPDTAMYVANVNRTTEGVPGVGSGNNGGLESDGRLASLVAVRKFDRLKNVTVDYDHPQVENKFTAVLNTARFAGSDELSLFFPETPFPNANGYASTPTDLVNITNAKEVMSVDYFEEEKRTGVILATLTENEVYNHTKVICDRLAGASLNQIRTLNVEGYSFILTRLTQADGNTEYATHFVVYEKDDKLYLQTEWGLGQYPENDKFYNFQIWAKAPHITQKMIEEVLIKLNEYKSLEFVQSQLLLPKVYVRKGNYRDGVLQLEVENQCGATEVTFNGALSRTETAGMFEDWTFSFPLSGQAVETFSLPVGKLFDTGFSVKNNMSQEEDYLYLADGPWGIAPSTAEDNITLFEVSHTDAFSNAATEMAVERNVEAKGSVFSGVSLFRIFKSNAAPVNLNQYSHLTFKGMNKGEIEMVLVKASVKEWGNQPRTSLKLGESLSDYSFPLSVFRTGNSAVDFSDVTSVVFAIKGDSRTIKDFEIQIQNLAFVSKESINEELTVDNIQPFPNPAKENVTLKFIANESEDATVNIFDKTGKLVLQKVISIKQGENAQNITVSEIESGVYFLQLRRNNGVSQCKLLID